MSSEAITQNDLREILSRTVGSVPSEYKKLLWTNPNTQSAFSSQYVYLDLSNYDAVGIDVNMYTASAGEYHQTFYGRIGENLLMSGLIYQSSMPLSRLCEIRNDSILFNDGYANTPNNQAVIPIRIYGIKYERVQPPVLDAEIEVLATGITLYRIGRIRALHISDATGFTKSSLIPSADRPSADIQGVAIRTTNGNLATSFGRIVVGSNGDVGALYSSVLNGSQTGFSVASSTDHIIGTAIWYVAE